jgi:hypothetical protein
MPHCCGRSPSAALKRAALLCGGLGVTLMLSNTAGAQGLSHYNIIVGADYRRAQLDWNIAGNNAGTNPNVLSELTWRDLEIAQVSAVAQAILGDHVVVQGSGDYGQVMHGKNQDSDYLGDNRTLEYSRSNNEGTGNISDASFGLGYRFRLLDSSVGHYAQVIPLAGYSIHSQNLKIKNGMQVVPASAAGPIPGLDTAYDAEWKGPWLGLNMRLEASARTSILVDLGYHWADYSAEADWNLRNDLAHPVSFRHDAKGTGIVTTVAFTHMLNRHWEFIARLESQHWTSNTGVDTSFDTSTGSVQAETTRLNVVHWRTRLAGVAASYHF